MKKNKKLLNFMARMCLYAQEHVGSPDAWPTSYAKREQYFQCTSFAVACFLAQNTVEGDQGVECDIILAELCCNKLDKNGFMCKNIDEWKNILKGLVEEYGGWK